MKNIFLVAIIFLFSCKRDKGLLVKDSFPVMMTATPTVNGYASLNGGTTGGYGGEIVIVKTKDEFRNAISGTTTRIVYVDGTIEIGYATVGSNKSIIGLGLTAKTIGTIRLEGSKNIIIKNIICTNPTGDGIAAAGSTNFLISHCTIYNCGDGCIDVIKGSNYYTIEWNYFYYDKAGDHNFTNLVGSDNNDPDQGKLNGTFHHNYYGKYCIDRMPRVRFGKVHVYNNYYDPAVDVKVSALITAAISSQILAENNHFESGDDGFEYREDGKILGRGTTYGAKYIGEKNKGNTTTMFTPPYNYILDSTAIPAKTGAGVNGDTSTTGVVTEPPADPKPDSSGDIKTFVLWNADKDIPIRQIVNGEIFDISDLGTVKFSVQSVLGTTGWASVKLLRIPGDR